MAEYRRATRPTLEAIADGGIVIGVTPTGHLQWITPEPAAQPAHAEQAPTAQVISEQEQAAVRANREKIEQLKTLTYPSPDLHEIVAEIVAMTNPPALSLAVAAWVLQATGVIPMPIFDSAAAAVTAVGYIGRRVGHRLHTAHVPDEARTGAIQLWQTHPGIANQIVVTVMGRVIDSIRNAMSVDDTELENQLDAFYPRWSRTDFEFDLRRYQR
jgi:hypothetical protein